MGVSLQSVRELLMGGAFYPDPRDMGYPLEKRTKGMPILWVCSRGESFEIGIVRNESKTYQRSNEKLANHGITTLETVGAEELTEKLSWLRTTHSVEYAIWIEDHGWEVHSSNMLWEHSGSEFQRAVRSGYTMIPDRERESGMLYSPVIFPDKTNVLLFAVSAERLHAGIRSLETAGLKVVRSGIGMAMTVRRLLGSKRCTDWEAGYGIIETQGGVLLLCKENGRISVTGQWANILKTEDRDTVWGELQGRMDKSQALSFGCVASVEDEIFIVRRVMEANARTEKTHLIAAAIWDPESDVQPELNPEYPQVRPCLPFGGRLLQVGLWVMFVSLFVWWGSEFWRSRDRGQEITKLQAETKEVHTRLAQLEDSGQAMEKDREKIHRVGVWIQSLIHTPVLAAQILDTVPVGLRMRSFGMKLFEGQRQMELLADLQHIPEISEEWFEQVMQMLSLRGLRMISFDRPEHSGGSRFRAVMIHPLQP